MDATKNITNNMCGVSTLLQYVNKMGAICELCLGFTDFSMIAGDVH